MVKTEIRLIIFFAPKDGEALYSQHKQGWERTVARIMSNSFSKPFRYENQIFYDYTTEVTNIFKGLDLMDRVPEELWMEVHDIIQEAGIKTIPKKKKGKMAV